MDPPAAGVAAPSVEQFLATMGVGSPGEFISQAQAMQRQQGVLVTATDELRNALATSQAMAADAAARVAKAEGECGGLVKAMVMATDELRNALATSQATQIFVKTLTGKMTTDAEARASRAEDEREYLVDHIAVLTSRVNGLEDSRRADQPVEVRDRQRLEDSEMQPEVGADGPIFV